MFKRRPLGGGGGIAGLGGSKPPGSTIVNKFKRPAKPLLGNTSSGSFVNLEVHFRGNWKVLTCSTKWNNTEILDHITKEFNVE